MFKPAFSEMGQLARTHPETLIFDLLAAGFTFQSFGRMFRRSDLFRHRSPGAGPRRSGGCDTDVDNAGDGPAWFLLDTSRGVSSAIGATLWRTRETSEFTALNRADDHNTFMNDEYLHGVRARVHAGFGPQHVATGLWPATGDMWQLAYGGTGNLTQANYAAARQAMMDFRSDRQMRVVAGFWASSQQP